MFGLKSDIYIYGEKGPNDESGYIIAAIFSVIIYLLGITIITFFILRFIAYYIFYRGGGII